MSSTTAAAATPNLPTITSADRMSFSLFLATAFHVLILLGISFTLPEKSKETFERALDVVLATQFSTERPEEADFVGQADQMGGGDSEEIEKPSTTETSPFPDEQMNEITQPEQMQVETAEIQDHQVLTSEISEQQLQQLESPISEQQDAVESLSAEEIYNRSMEIASLTAQLDAVRNNRAKRPRKRLVSAAIHRSSDALYLDSWRRKIERIGNLNYPEKAKKNGIYGNLSLKVAINKNGTVNNISILRSSGHKMLDDSAIRIVRLAAPFAPLTKEITIDTDILEIVRVWQFQPNNSMNTR